MVNCGRIFPRLLRSSGELPDVAHLVRIQQGSLQVTSTTTSPELWINIGHRGLVTESDAPTSSSSICPSYRIFRGLQVCPSVITSSSCILSLGINLDRVLGLDCPTEGCAALFENRASGVGLQCGPLILNEILPSQRIGGAKLSHYARIEVRRGQTHARTLFGDNLSCGRVYIVHDLR